MCVSMCDPSQLERRVCEDAHAAEGRNPQGWQSGARTHTKRETLLDCEAPQVV